MLQNHTETISTNNYAISPEPTCTQKKKKKKKKGGHAAPTKKKKKYLVAIGS